MKIEDFDFDETDGFIRVCDGPTYLILFGPEKYNFIYNRIRYHLSRKCGITYYFFLIIMQKSKLILLRL